MKVNTRSCCAALFLRHGRGRASSGELADKIDLVLAEYAKHENLEPSDADVITFLEEQAAKDGELSDQVAALKKSPSARRYFASRLRRQRVLDRLVEVAGATS